MSPHTGPVLIVGAGISGIACARALRDAGIEARVLDRGRALGGRMASRRFDGRPADLGAAFFTVNDPRFEAVVRNWERSGLAHPWTDTLSVLEPGGRRTTTGPLRWGASVSMRRLVEELATDLEVTSTEVRAVEPSAAGLRVGDSEASVVVLAMPDPQARVLLPPSLAAAAAVLDRPWDPALALAAWWPKRTWDGAAGERFHGAFVNGDPVVSWIADDGRRRGDDAPVLVAHSTPGFATPHLVDPQAAAPEFLAAVQRLLGIQDPPAGQFLQRWSVAKPAGERDELCWLSEEGVGFCGDGWGPVSRVEGAFLSGLAMAEQIVARFG